MALFLISVLCIVAAASAQELRYKRYITKYDQPFTFSCPNGQALWIMRSNHHSKYEDRVWDFVCQPNKAVSTQCMWTDYVNDYDGVMNFQCPFHSVIAGVGGVHHSKYEDRRYKFRCCLTPGYQPTGCKQTGYLNSMDGDLFYMTPSGYFMKGMYSYHHSKYEDRQFKTTICKLQSSQ